MRWFTQSMRFVGRERELTRIVGLLDALAAGHGGCAVAVGEMGVGKTRLLEEARLLARARELPVASAACLPLRTPLPFEPVLELLRACGIAAGARTDRPVELFASSVAEIESAAAERPLLLVLDDLQFSDLATLDLVHYCVARLADLPVAWLLATRPGGETDALVHHLARDELADVLPLRGLSRDELTAFLADVLGGTPADGLIATIERRTGGNPFFARELACAAATAGSTGEEALPRPVVDATMLRLGRLGADAQELVRWGAVLPEPWRAAWLGALGGIDPDDALRELARAGVIVEAPDGWGFEHAIVRDAVYESLGGTERIRRHSAAADLLGSLSHPGHAAQLEAAGRTAAAASAFVELAEEAVRRGGSKDAVQLFERAQALANGDEPLRRRAAAGTVLALLRADRVDDARSRADSLLRELPPGTDERLVFLARYAYALWEDASDVESARAAVDQIPAAADAQGRTRAEVALAQATVLDRGGDPAGAIPHAQTALRAAREIGDVQIETRALRRLGLARAQVESPEEGAISLRQAIRVAEEAGLSADAAGACLTLSHVFHMAGDENGHATFAQRGLAFPGVPRGLQALLHHNLAGARLIEGRLDEALAHALAAQKLARGGAPLTEARVAIIASYVEAVRGDCAAALRTLDALGLTPGSWDDLRAASTRGFILQQANRPAEALAAYEWAATTGDATMRREAQLGIVWAAAAMGDLDRATETLATMEDGRADWHLAAARGFAAAAAGREEAAELFEDAAAGSPERFRALEFRLEAARLRRDRGGISQAIAGFDEIGARGAADRARAIARSLGMRPGRRHRRGGVLTAREEEIANLAAAGKTNAEIARELFLSPRTVERHVANILSKLGYRSRVQLAAAVASGRLPA